jgi:hypothetical protein
MAAISCDEPVMRHVLFAPCSDDYALIAAGEQQGWICAIAQPSQKLAGVNEAGYLAVCQARAQLRIKERDGHGVIDYLAVTSSLQRRYFVQVLRRFVAFASVHVILRSTQ